MEGTHTRATATFGDLVDSRNHETSATERRVFEHLREVGVPVAEQRLGILCHHPGVDRAGRPLQRTKGLLTITPDIVIPDWRLVIEVDPCGDVESRGFTHRGKEDEDRLRNDLLSAVGWTTIRLRLSAASGERIGHRDVTVESAGFTKAAQAALMEAIDDFRAGVEGRIRHVPKSASPRPAQRRSHVVNIGEYAWADGGHIFSWYPSLQTREKITLRLALDGRYLYTHHSERFIAEVGLHLVPESEWKKGLTAFLADRSPADLGTTKWPWGESLLIGSDRAEAVEVIERCEHRKHTIDRTRFWFSVSGAPASQWTPTELRDDVGNVVVAFAPEAVALGYHFEHVEALHGRYGPYAEVFVSRIDTSSPEVTATT